MAAEHFRAAIDSTGITPEQLAQVIEVDPKTVHRWLGGRVPYPRHRAAIARALDTPEYLLWPDDVPAPAPLPQTEAPRSDDHPEEVVASWGGRADPRRMDPAPAFAQARRQIDILAPAPQLLNGRSTPGALVQAAERGCHVRILATSDALKIDRISQLAEHPEIEIRTRDELVGHAVFRADATVFLGVWLAGEEGPPFVQATRRRDHGLFDAVTSHFERLWDLAGPDAGDAASPPAATHASPDPSPAPRRWPRG